MQYVISLNQEIKSNSLTSLKSTMTTEYSKYRGKAKVILQFLCYQPTVLEYHKRMQEHLLAVVQGKAKMVIQDNHTQLRS
jgi:mannose-6-phosphate isomerase-like protein (cupin superfamily)